MLARPVLRQRRSKNRLLRDNGGVRTKQPVEHGKQEDHGTDERRDGVSRKAKDTRRAEHSGKDRLAGPHGHLAETELQPRSGKRASDEIAFADRRATDCYENIGIGSPRDGARQVAFVVARDA